MQFMFVKRIPMNDDFLIVNEHLEDRAAEDEEQGGCQNADDQAAFLCVGFDTMEAFCVTGTEIVA